MERKSTHVAFLGCGFITTVHSRHLTALPGVRRSYASRDLAKAESFRSRFDGARAFGSYEAAIGDPDVDAVVVAVPPAFHLDLTLAALAAGKHVLVEKPAFPAAADFETVRQARDAAGTVVLVGENDHYKPLAVTLRGLLADGVIGDLVMAHFTTVADKPKTADDWRNDEALAGGDAFFEEGIHWLHLAGSLGPRITEIHGFRPAPATAPAGTGRRAAATAPSRCTTTPTESAPSGRHGGATMHPCRHTSHPSHPRRSPGGSRAPRGRAAST